MDEMAGSPMSLRGVGYDLRDRDVNEIQAKARAMQFEKSSEATMGAVVSWADQVNAAALEVLASWHRFQVGDSEVEGIHGRQTAPASDRFMQTIDTLRFTTELLSQLAKDIRSRA